MKRVLSLLMAFCLLLTIVPMTVFADGEAVPNPESYPKFADLSYGALYAHATLGGESAQDWQRWHKDQKGVNFEDGIRYFFLPKTADDNQVEIYNNYNDTITIDDVTIEPYTSAFIDYTEGETISAIRNKDTDSEKEYTFVVLKSDAEASVYVNDNTNSYEDCNGIVQNTDLWSFLVQDKENSVSDSSCAIVDENGVLDTTLKKIKGRGNTNWKETDKKPFNLTFYDKTNIGGVVDKKFSFVSNAKDSTLLRNSIMYDLAYNVGSPYAPDQSFVDFYVNGVYRGAYIACQKIDLGKNSVVSLKDNSDDMDTGFNFLVEVDVWNYKSDVYFVSDKGYHVVLKTPDLDGYDEADISMKTKYEYIKETYQKLEDALYNGTLEDIEKICDLESLASQYLLQEFGKNCDGGYTSTFFTYNADEEKFYAAPLWDCDSDLGAVDCVRDGCSTSTIDHTGWITRIAKYEKTVNPLGQAFNVEGKSADGKTFEEICAQMWNEKFIPMIDVILGNDTAQGRLKSIDEYAASIEKYAYNNYIMWNYMWLCAQKNSSLGIKYEKDYEGEIQYLKDWTKERANWMSQAFNEEPVEIQNDVVYFKTDLDWDNVHYYSWGTGYIPVKWPGEQAELIETTEAGEKIYKAKVYENVTKIIFNNGNDGEQTVDITLNTSNNLFTSTDSTGETNKMGYDIYNVVAGVFEETDTTVSTKPTTTDIYTEPTTLVAVTETTIFSVATDNTENTEATQGTTETVITEPTEATTGTDSTDVTTETEPTETTTDCSETARTEVSSAETVIMSSTATQNELLLGDVNLDYKVNIKDATALQKHLAKLTSLSEDGLKVSDTNKDGRITISDATTIQKKIAGLIKWD